MDKVTRLSADHNFWRERRAEADSNRGPSAYQPNALITVRPNRLTTFAASALRVLAVSCASALRLCRSGSADSWSRSTYPVSKHTGLDRRQWHSSHLERTLLPSPNTHSYLRTNERIVWHVAEFCLLYFTEILVGRCCGCMQWPSVCADAGFR